MSFGPYSEFGPSSGGPLLRGFTVPYMEMHEAFPYMEINPTDYCLLLKLFIFLNVINIIHHHILGNFHQIACGLSSGTQYKLVSTAIGETYFQNAVSYCIFC